MISLRAPVLGILSFMLCLALTGCLPSGGNPIDEQKEPHFLTGKKRINSMDYKGAIAAFEQALEANPRSASAHFELALLFEQKDNDYAAAIYHFDRYLRLRPKSGYAKLVEEHINTCKQELAATVSLGPVSARLQRDLDRLHSLELENADLKRKLAEYEGRSLAATNPAAIRAAPMGVSNSAAVTTPGRMPAGSSNLNPPARLPSPASSKTHSVKSGETLTSIARQYGVSVTALMAANPGVDARRLRIGQPLTIPGP